MPVVPSMEPLPNTIGYIGLCNGIVNEKDYFLNNIINNLEILLEIFVDNIHIHIIRECNFKVMRG